MASVGLGVALQHLRALFGAGSVAGLEDAQLLARYQLDRDEVAFEALIARHGPMVLTVCRAVLVNQHDVEDAFQTTFLVLARKAMSVRSAEALGGWLHRVAYRASVQAGLEASRRRRKEAEAAAMAPKVESPSDPERGRILHAEIDRLPDSQRLAVVLCDLEGLTYEEAANRLRWTVPAFRHRLARGRQTLKARLTRRGITPSVMLGLPGPLVPPDLAASTLTAVTRGSTSIGAALLTHNVLKGMLMTKLKLGATSVLAVLALTSVGMMAGGSGDGEPDDPRPPAVVSETDSGETVEIKGRVVDPTGKPVSGARITASPFDHEFLSRPEATSGADGRFSIRLARSMDSDTDDLLDRPWLIASAKGFGPGWISGVLKPGSSAEVTIKLVEEGVPIEGRLVDRENRPIVGARVAIRSIEFAQVSRRAEDTGDLSRLLSQIRDSVRGFGPISEDRVERGAVQVDPLPELRTKTDADGRFRLTGIGRERIASLLISAPSIVDYSMDVMTRDEPEVLYPRQLGSTTRSNILHSPRFQAFIPPCKPVQGMARDLDTSQPLAGMKVRVIARDPRQPYGPISSGVETVTDSAGRYVVTGLPEAESYRVFVTPASRPSLYPNAMFNARPAWPGLEPVSFDFVMKKGVVVRGRVTDKVTGRPVKGYVYAVSYGQDRDRPNPPGYAQDEPYQAPLDEDGRYELSTPPGYNIIGCLSDTSRYLPARLEKELPKTLLNPRDLRGRSLPGLNPTPHAVDLRNLDPDREATTLDLTVDPGGLVQLSVFDSDGRTIGGTMSMGTRYWHHQSPIGQTSATFEVRTLAKNRPRRVTVWHEGRKQIGSLWFRGDEVGPRSLHLVPWGAIEGRIAEKDEALHKYTLHSREGRGRLPTPNELEGEVPGFGTLDGLPIAKDGGFRIERLVPGLSYSSSVIDGLSIVELFRDVVVGPGETRNLGDLKARDFPNR